MLRTAEPEGIHPRYIRLIEWEWSETISIFISAKSIPCTVKKLNALKIHSAFFESMHINHFPILSVNIVFFLHAKKAGKKLPRRLLCYFIALNNSSLFSSSSNCKLLWLLFPTSKWRFIGIMRENQRWINLRCIVSFSSCLGCARTVNLGTENCRCRLIQAN